MTAAPSDGELDRVLELVPELQAAGRRVTPIPGGMTNRNYRVTTSDGDYVVRVSVSARAMGELGIDRDNEHHNSMLAAAAGVGAPVIARVRDPEALVVRYLTGTTLSPADFRDRRRVSVLAGVLRRLHAAGSFARDFDMFDVQRHYQSIVIDNGYPLPAEYARYGARAEAVQEVLAATREHTAPCHNDLMPGNFIEAAGPGSPIAVIDYEYSGNNDPIYDLGDAINELELGTEHATQLVTEYHGTERPQQVARARLWSLMSKYGWSLWGSIRIGTTGDPEIREWAQALWTRARAEFDSPEFEPLLVRAKRPDRRS
jgi:thiamine kinase-like enzyme